MNFFTADLHLVSEDRRIFMGLPKMTDTEYIDTIVNNINEACTSNDDLWIIGDFIDCRPEFEDTHYKEYMTIAKELKPRTHLIIGNNEERIVNLYMNGNSKEFDKYCKDCGFTSVDKQTTVEIKGLQFNLVHNYLHGNKKMLNMFGHAHAMFGCCTYGLNVGINYSFLRPLSEEEILFRVACIAEYHKDFDTIFKEPFNQDLWNKYKTMEVH